MRHPTPVADRARHMQHCLEAFTQEEQRIHDERTKLDASLRSARARRAEIQAGLRLRSRRRAGGEGIESQEEALAEMDRYLERLQREEFHLQERERYAQETLRQWSEIPALHAPGEASTSEDMEAYRVMQQVVARQAKAHRWAQELEAQLSLARRQERKGYLHILEHLTELSPGTAEILVRWLEAQVLPRANPLRDEEDANALAFSISDAGSSQEYAL